MKKQEWIEIGFEQCPVCGDELEALTDCGEKDGVQHFWDGDEVKCLGNCGTELQITVDEYCAFVSGEW